MYCVLFFFFSSRRRHTRFDCDWSSDVCSSDLSHKGGTATLVDSNTRFFGDCTQGVYCVANLTLIEKKVQLQTGDRKSTRLNSSHSQISYAVFCLKKKNNRTMAEPL